MENDKILIPFGWTYFAHRSNTERWSEDPFELKSIITNKVVSVITESDVYQDVKHYGKNGMKGFSSGTGKPFEIRCLICQLPYLKSLPDSFEVKDIMLKKFYFDRDNFGGARGQRHHSIPKNEELIVMGIGNYDEAFEKDANIIWVIPKSYVEFYKEELKRENNREISLNGPKANKKL